METLNVFAEIAVPHRDVGAGGLLRGSMGQIVVIGRLVGEAFARHVHLQERLGARVELTVARELRIARLDAFLGVACGRTGSYQAAVEDHRGAGEVFGGACPHGGLDRPFPILPGSAGPTWRP